MRHDPDEKDIYSGYRLEERLKKAENNIRNIQNGRIRSNASVTLTANVATTVVTDRRAGRDSTILFMPLTANAAAELGNGTMYVKTTDIDPRNSQFTINHANNAQADRSFRYIVLGEELS